MRVAAIVPAAGRGERLGPGTPKALRLLGGVPLLVHAVRALSSARLVDLVVVAGPPEGEAEVRALLDAHDVAAEVRVVAGGETRQESVRRALDVLPADVAGVLVHDAARPLAPSDLADDVAQALIAGVTAVIPVMPVTDTIKRVDVSGHVLQTLPRAELVAVQTPQGFARSVLAEAHDAAALDGFEGTDDASLVERLGVPVQTVAGYDDAFKVTRPGDLAHAETVLRRRLERRDR
ncbi:MAG TPA: 2-C-methyl-D-erythritol 4-phosphate cytidylyltransferase [Mycobacteriales bacterium]|nr:2-C-methyl-D-erythritol 4-phosphate cytidylyltransferase [Mycobacteriales bacterium]